jgi:hypothetical protein
MKGSYFSLAAIIMALFLLSCKKGKIESKPSASLIVTTAVVGGGNVKLNTNVRDSAKAYNAKAFVIVAGSSDIKLYSTSDPAKPYYSATQQTETGSIYSIFLGGQGAAAEGIFVKETALQRYTDSSLGVRIINLSPNSTSVNITMASDTNTKVFTGVAYKGLTEFVKLPLKSVIPTNSVTFQVRDNVTNKVLTTYTLPTTVNSTYPNISTTLSRDRNLTLVIKGLQGTTGSNPDAFGVFPVALY